MAPKKKNVEEQMDLLTLIDTDEKDQEQELYGDEVSPVEANDIEEEEYIVSPSGERFSVEEWTSPIVAGGPTRQEVEEWKDKHGHVYFTPFEAEIYIWRTLDRPEYREIIRNQEITMLDREEIITEKCVLYPRNFTAKTMIKGRAGVPSLLSEMIMDKSGFVAQSAPIKL